MSTVTAIQMLCMCSSTACTCFTCHNGGKCSCLDTRMQNKIKILRYLMNPLKIWQS